MNNSVCEVISDYLKDFADTSLSKRLEPSLEVVDALRKNPDDAFQVIANGLYQKPENLDFRDLDDPLFRLLTTFVDLVPEVVIPKMTKGFWGGRYLYIQCAAASKAPIFVPTIINLLADRTIYIKILVLQLILQYPHLQVPEAMPQFEKLGKMKSFQDSEADRQLLEQAKQCVASKI